MVTPFIVLSIFEKFDSNWPRPLTDVLSVFQFSYLNLDVFATECSLSISYYNKYVLKFLLPLYFFLCTIGTYLLVKLHAFIIVKFDIRRIMEIRYPFLFRPSNDFSNFSRLKMNILKFLCTPYELSWRGIINSMTMFLDVLYIYLVSVAFELLNCYKQPDGSSTLFAYPAIQCYDEDWYSLLPLSIISIILYTVGIPLAFSVALVLNRKKLDSAKFNQTFGYLTRRWGKKNYGWGLLILLRKFLLSFVIVTWGGTLDVQFLGSLLTIYPAILLHTYNKPYLISLHNSLETITLNVVFSILLFGILQHQGFSSGTLEKILAWIFVLILTAVIVSFGYICVKLSQRYFKSKVTPISL